MKDLVEYQWDFKLKRFMKKQTHVTNRLAAICYSEKRKIQFLRPASRFTKFKVVPNGQKQHTNQF